MNRYCGDVGLSYHFIAMARSSKNQSDSSDEKLNRTFNSLTIRTRENTEGKWLPCHPWGSENKPNPNDTMRDKINISSKHPLSLEWAIEGSGKKKFLNLKTILLNLPKVVKSEMKGSINGGRRELEWLVCRNYHNSFDRLPTNPSDLLPHTREIIDRETGNDGIDRRSLPRHRDLKATSLETYNFTSFRRPKEKIFFTSTVNICLKCMCLATCSQHSSSMRRHNG